MSEKCQRCNTREAVFSCDKCDLFKRFCRFCDTYVHGLPSKKSHVRYSIDTIVNNNNTNNTYKNNKNVNNNTNVNLNTADTSFTKQNNINKNHNLINFGLPKQREINNSSKITNNQKNSSKINTNILKNNKLISVQQNNFSNKNNNILNIMTEPNKNKTTIRELDDWESRRINTFNNVNNHAGIENEKNDFNLYSKRPLISNNSNINNINNINNTENSNNKFSNIENYNNISKSKIFNDLNKYIKTNNNKRTYADQDSYNNEIDSNQYHEEENVDINENNLNYDYQDSPYSTQKQIPFSLLRNDYGKLLNLNFRSNNNNSKNDNKILNNNSNNRFNDNNFIDEYYVNNKAISRTKSMGRLHNYNSLSNKYILNSNEGYNENQDQGHFQGFKNREEETYNNNLQQETETQNKNQNQNNDQYNYQNKQNNYNDNNDNDINNTDINNHQQKQIINNNNSNNNNNNNNNNPGNSNLLLTGASVNPIIKNTYSREYVNELKSIFMREKNELIFKNVSIQNTLDKLKNSFSEQISMMTNQIEDSNRKHQFSLKSLEENIYSYYKTMLLEKETEIEDQAEKVRKLISSNKKLTERLNIVEIEYEDFTSKQGATESYLRKEVETKAKEIALLHFEAREKEIKILNVNENSEKKIVSSYEETMNEMSKEFDEIKNRLNNELNKRDTEIEKLKVSNNEHEAKYSRIISGLNEEIVCHKQNLNCYRERRVEMENETRNYKELLEITKREAKIQYNEIKLIDNSNKNLMKENDELKIQMSKLDKLVYGKIKQTPRFKNN